MKFKILQLRSLKTRVTLFTLTIFLISIWSLAFYNSHMLREDLQGLLGEQQFSTATYIAAEINAALEQRIEAIVKVASDLSPALQRGNMESLQTLLANYPIIQILFNGGTFVTGIDGIAIADVPFLAGRIGINYADRDFMPVILKEGKTTVSRPFMGKALKAPVFAIAAPIRDAQGKVLGALVGGTDLSKPNFLDKITHNRYGKTGGYLLIAPQHELVVTGTDKSRIMRPIPAPGINPLFDRYKQGYEGSGVVTDSQGIEVLSSARQIPAAGWFIVARIPTAEAFAPIHAMQRRMLLIAIFMSILAGGLTWWILQRQLAPMIAVAKTLATRSDTNQPLQPLAITHQDEIGELIGGFNRLLETLGQREEALLENRKRLADIIQFLPDATLAIDKQKRVIIWNEAIEKITGIPAEDMIGKGDHAYTIPFYGKARSQLMDLVFEDREEIAALYPHIIREDDTLTAESFCNALYNNKGAWIFAKASPLYDPSGNIVGAIEIIRDITEIKQAQEERTLNTQRLQMLLQLNQMTEATLREVTDFALEECVRLTKSTIGYLAFLNGDESVLTMYSCSKSAMAECAIADKQIIFPVETTGLWGEAVRQRRPVITNDYNTSDPLVKGFPKGHVAIKRHMNIPVFSGSKIVLVAGVGNKIEEYNQEDVQQLTVLMEGMWRLIERKRVKETLVESEEKFRLMFNSSPDAVNIIRVDTGSYVDINEGFSRTTGFTRDEVIGKTALELNIWQDYADSEQLIQGLREKGYVENLEAQFRRKDGSLVTGLMSTRLISLKGIPHFISITRDITEHKKHENERLKIEKLESLGILAGGIAHDFNNILTGIMGNISFAKVFLDANHTSYKPLAEAEKASVRAGELAHQLLTFSRGGEPVKKLTSLQKLADESISLVLHGSNVKGTVDIPDSIHAIEADEGQISQVFHNVIINATQAMPGGGTLTVTAQNEMLAGNNALSLPPGPYVRLTFTDQGCGIPNENLKKIFDPYFTTKSAGNGLGLASAHSIISRHGGHIGVSSVAGEGTTFSIYLPSLGEIYTKYDTGSAWQATAERKGGSILVMDDEEMVRDIAKSMLIHLGYEVTTCANGEKAVELYKTSMESGMPFETVIMDLTIPGGLGGQEAAKRILSLFPKACLIVSSGYSNDPIMSNYREYGFSGAIAKPYNLHEFEQVLASLG